MFDKSADYYDLIYSFKNYEDEAAKVVALLKEHHQAATDILDVACGTARHAAIIKQQSGYRIDGIDLNEDFIRIAQARHNNGQFTVADMTAFDLGTSYDVVMSLFSSIGYALNVNKLESALACFRRHVRNDGIVIVEPWLTPDNFESGRHHEQQAEQDGMRVTRHCLTAVEDHVSTLHFNYIVEQDGKQERFEETHRLGLFTVDEMQQAFNKAGLKVTYDEHGLTGRGLYIGRPQP